MDSGYVKGETACITASKEPLETARQNIVLNRFQNPETYPQVWKGDNQSQRSCGTLQHCVRDHVTHDGRSCGKLQHGDLDHDMLERSCGKLQQDNAQGAVLDSAGGTAGKWFEELREICNKRLKSNYRRPGWTTITCKSQIMGTLRKFS